ncbi:FbpB family small basic protein [Bacillus sp. FJAT-50079]|nr:FbpB family small basic protein [Bacillus sp. FJAT-50079]MBS4208438.1 FbpB family small basic protein [Bacillus sp. FJAT-50079]
MKKGKISMEELIRENKAELLKDKEWIEEIEKRIEEKYINQNK